MLGIIKIKRETLKIEFHNLDKNYEFSELELINDEISFNYNNVLLEILIEAQKSK